MSPEAGSPVVAVFVPGLMGAGILISGGILLADGIRRILPNRGVRRRVTVARGVHGVVEGLARAAGYKVPEHYLFPRQLRSRWAYLAAAAILGAVGALAVLWGDRAYTDPEGTLYRNGVALLLGVAVGAPLLLAAVLSLALAVRHARSGSFLRRLVMVTLLGRITPPPEDPRERARTLHPWLQEQEEEVT